MLNLLFATLIFVSQTASAIYPPHGTVLKPGLCSVALSSLGLTKRPISQVISKPGAAEWLSLLGKNVSVETYHHAHYLPLHPRVGRALMYRSGHGTFEQTVELVRSSDNARYTVQKWPVESSFKGIVAQIRGATVLVDEAGHVIVELDRQLKENPAILFVVTWK